ncbi:MAG: aldo/keto reductase [Lachnospiraceae bacterium]|jgi:aryl-alcohol dehydrogenase-like predicted oxidoreductase|nr:aldo/keto reductase [Lachnospiraceae bacterium]
MRQITLGSTGITVPQNAFGALPIQRVSKEAAVALLRRAYEGGMRFFDTARAYSDSEEKVGEAFEGMRDKVFISSKTMARTPEKFWSDLEESLRLLKTDHLDIHQFHCVDQCYKPGDGTGMYEAMLEAKAQGKVRHIGITAHKIGVAEEIVASGLYETLQFPFSYLSGDREVALVKACKDANMGFICMKAIAGGLITNAKAAAAYIYQFDNALPIWGIQKEEELDEWLALFDETPAMDAEIEAFIAKEREELSGEFCRGCGYCKPCTVDISINDCARWSLMVRRAPSDVWLNEANQAKMRKIEDCIDCGICMTRCPYELPIPTLLRKNYEDFQNIISGKTKLWNYN